MVEIRAMTEADVEAAVELASAANWRSRRSFYDLALSLPTCTPLVLEDGGRVIATGVATANGRVGWVGTILVAPDRRREGFGQAITEAVCERLTAAGCTTLALIATELGRPLYEHLGFDVRTHYRVVEADALPDAPAPPAGLGLRPIRESDMAAVLELDAGVSGEDRSAILERLAPAGWVLEDGSRLRGFLLEAGRGFAPTIAERADDALCLLELHRHLTPAGLRARAVLLDENEEAAALLEAHGWRETWRAPRMLRGPDVAWRPRAIWGVANFAMG